MVDDEGYGSVFEWRDREAAVSDDQSELCWAKHLAKWYRYMTDVIDHHSLKNNLVEHVWNRQVLL